MILYVQSDASYLSRPHAKSVAGGFAYLWNHDDLDFINGPIYSHTSTIRNVCTSAAEAEYVACFINAKLASWFRIVLTTLGYPQIKPTKLLCDNSVAVGLANTSIKPKFSKSIDMNFHWLREHVTDGIFDVYWQSGATNLADFFTKALPVHQFVQLKPNFNQVPRTSTQFSINSVNKFHLLQDYDDLLEEFF
jgi:hypothetical protein